MDLVAGKNGWSNSISWILLLEDLTIIRHFSGKELAVTTGLGFQEEEKLLSLAEELNSKNAAYNPACGRIAGIRCNYFCLERRSEKEGRIRRYS